MGTALADVPNFVATQPPGVVRVRIDPDTGRAASASEPDAIFELFLAEYAPTPIAQETDQTTLRPEEIFSSSAPVRAAGGTDQEGKTPSTSASG